jgi:hypothetical protein
MSPPGGNENAWCIEELESRMFGVYSLIVTMAAMAGGSVSSLIFVSEFTRARSPIRPKNVILREIMMIFISFKDADLLHYLLPNVFTQRRRVWGTIAAVERAAPHRGLLISFFLIFPHFSLFLCEPAKK